MIPTEQRTAEACWACGTPATPTEEFLPAPYRRCPSCGLVFQPHRDAAELRGLYDEAYFEDYAGGDYAEDDADRRSEARVRVRRLRRVLAGGRLLEIGAAGGHFLAEARRAGFDPVGIEPVAAFAAAARRRSGATVHEGFIEDAALEPASFDVACAFHVLEHIERPLPVLERLGAALRPGGVLFVEVPNIESFQARRLRSGWANLEPLHHVGQYAPASLRTMLEAAGFDVLEAETVPFFSYLRPARALTPLHLAHRAVLSARARVPLRGPHPSRHELLRAFARVPWPSSTPPATS